MTVRWNKDKKGYLFGSLICCENFVSEPVTVSVSQPV